MRPVESGRIVVYEDGHFSNCKKKMRNAELYLKELLRKTARTSDVKVGKTRLLSLVVLLAQEQAFN